MRRASLFVLPLLLLLLLARPASSADDTRRALAALRAARSTPQRLAAVKLLEVTDQERGATALAKLVANDPAIEVRVRAAHALGRMHASNTSDLLFRQVIDGGPLAVRDAVAWALSKKDKAARRLRAGLDQRGRTVLERGLLLEALGRFRDEGTRETLIERMREPDPYLQAEALRALLTREDAPVARTALLVRILTEGRDAQTLLPALEAAEIGLVPVLRPALERLTTFLEPSIAEAARHLLLMLEVQTAKEPPAPAPAAPGNGHTYGTPRQPPPIHPPGDIPTRSKHDVVYLLDVTGSTVMTLPMLRARIRQEIKTLVDQGLNLRVGIIAYRGGHGRGASNRGLEILPLTYDPTRAYAFLEDLKAGGVDDRGASVALALHLALDQMGWRRGARRTAKLIADSGCENPEDAIRRAGIHYRAERTRTYVAYVLRTRRQVPPEYDRLARAGGTGAVELFE